MSHVQNGLRFNPIIKKKLVRMVRTGAGWWFLRFLKERKIEGGKARYWLMQ
jgi:hypothetical protein